MERVRCLAAAGFPTPVLPSPDQELEFHALSWTSRDEEEGDDEGDATFVVRVHGVTRQGVSVGLRATGFTPFFYVSGPPGWRGTGASLADGMRDLAASLPHCGLLGARVFRYKDFWGFTHGGTREFVRLSFGTHRGMRRMAWALGPASGRPAPRALARAGVASLSQLRLYESKLDPLLRLLHIRDLRPAGWVRVAAGRWRSLPGDAPAGVACEASWTELCPGAAVDMAPLVVASFDLECNSAHGDFPVAVKDYSRLAMDLEDAWERASGSAAPAIRTLPEYDACSALLGCMRRAMGLPEARPGLAGGLGLHAGPGGGHPVHALHLKRPLGPGLDGGLDGGLDAGHLGETLGGMVGDVLAALRRPDDAVVPPAREEGEEEEEGKGDDGPAPRGRLAGVLAVLNRGLLPRWPLRGDEIIQVGVTVGVVGAPDGSACCRRHVLTLGDCAPLEGGVVCRSFGSEAQLLLAWAELVRELDPDVLVGYNIFGFDMAYLWQRAQDALPPEGRAEFARLGRVPRAPSEYVERKLSSSALGDNLLRYIDMPGRVVVDLMKVVQRDHRLESYRLDAVADHFLGERKHDVSPNDIFRLQRGSPQDRRVIAEYCVQDCELCNRLAARLDLLAHNMGMANVCSVPLGHIFMRGQGIKILSLVAKRCRADGFLIPTRPPPPDEAPAYEGAVVLDPEVGMYLRQPIAVLDYNSLYPSSMISHNLSHDRLVLDPAYAAVPGVEYRDVEYEVGAQRVVARFAQAGGQEEEGVGVLPRILRTLLAARKATRERAAQVRVPLGEQGGELVGRLDGGELLPEGGGERVALTPEQVAGARPAHTPFQLAMLDGLQLAYKVTANSLYGQMGSRTSALYLLPVAACTTAVGRQMIGQAKAFVEATCPGARVVYGDTDSIFVAFGCGPGLTDEQRLEGCIRQGQAVSLAIRPHLPPPHHLEYEKTLFPLVLLSKKRYVGLQYGDDPRATPRLKSMGVALKRRDYAPIVKTIYGGVLDIILRQRDVPAAVAFLGRSLRDLADARYDLADLVISKTLRSYYKFPHYIPHWVLARRMRDRDPGSAPQPNDRVPYVFVETSKKGALMGDRIEHVDHVRARGLRVDTKTYIQNQIMKPCTQLLAIALEQLPGYRPVPLVIPGSRAPPAPLGSEAAWRALLEAKRGDATKARERLDTLREREVERLVFQPVLSLPVFRERDNRCSGQRELTHWVTRP